MVKTSQQEERRRLGRAFWAERTECTKAQGCENKESGASMKGKLECNIHEGQRLRGTMCQARELQGTGGHQEPPWGLKQSKQCEFSMKDGPGYTPQRPRCELLVACTGATACEWREEDGIWLVEWAG